MHSHRTLHALITLLTLVLILTGQSAPTRSAQAETPPPPPARDSYTNWEGPTHALPRLPNDAAAAAGRNIVPQMNCFGDSKLVFTGLVFDSVNTTDYNDDIYYNTNVCGEEYTRLTTDAADDFMPRLSKDGKKVVFVSMRDGNTEIYTVKTSGGAQTRLTNNESGDSMPAFSPDGTKIVFASSQVKNGQADIFVMNANGTNRVRLTTAEVNDLEPDWSPDGKQIAFVRRASDNRSGALYVMNADGSNQHIILGYSSWLARPVWSPSGKKLAFMYDPNGDSWNELGTINADGTGLTNVPITIIDPYTDLVMGGWLPDDSGLVYNARRLIYEQNQWWIYSSYLYRYDFETGEVSQPIYLEYVYYPHARSLDDNPPKSTLSPMSEWTQAGNTLFSYTASDNYAGLSAVNLEASIDNTHWILEVTGYPSKELTVSDTITWETGNWVGKKVYYRTRAMDQAGNIESDQKLAATWTKFYSYLHSFLVTDVRDHPLSQQPVTVSPTAMNPTNTGADGRVQLYMSGYNPSVTYARPGYANLPVQHIGYPKNLSIHTVLPGADEVLVNGFFNNTQDHLAGWQKSNVVYLGYADPQNYIGGAVRFGPCSYTNSACNSGEATLSQAISLPSTMTNPTLSFFIATSDGGSDQSTLQVSFTPQGSQPVILSNQATRPNQASHHIWVDMSPYRGQTGTLTFRFNQAAGDTHLSVFLEQISLSSWTTPVLTSAGPLSILAGAADGTWIDLDGENFAPTAQVFLGSQEITALERTGSTHIRFQLPVGIANGPYDLHIVNPGGAEARPERPLWVGYFLNLPSVSR